MEPKIIRKVGLAAIKNQQILMTREGADNPVFYFLGGTVEQGETDLECLTREVMEEAHTEIKPESIEFLEEFEDWAHGRENTRVNIRLYKGELKSDPVASSEVVEIRYIDSSIDHQYLSPIANNHIFPWLKNKGYIK